jgi:hypothetical protein
VTTDVPNRAAQAFWAMHVEAMNWSGLSLREYAAELNLSPYSLRNWRDQIDANVANRLAIASSSRRSLGK